VQAEEIVEPECKEAEVEDLSTKATVIKEAENGGINGPKEDQPASKDKKRSSNSEKSPSKSANNEVSRAWFALSGLYHTMCSFYDLYCLQNWEKIDSGR
jgi:hypothetical protein